MLAVLALAAAVALVARTSSSIDSPDRSRPWRGAARAGHAGWDELSREFDRARRFDRTFALVLIEVQEEEPHGRLEALAPRLRTCDRVWASGPSLYVLMPETSSSDALATIDRLITAGTPVVMRVVEFPRDGLTSEALLEQLAGRNRPGEARSSNAPVADVITDG